MSGFSEIYPAQLQEEERGALGRELRVGLGLSGGGIRSATFSLGVLQALANAGILEKVGVLSTVSGGGYIGSFLGSLYSRYTLNPDGSPPVEGEVRSQRVREILEDPRSEPIKWLRESGHYMSPNGAGDVAIAVAAFARNWVTVQLILGVFILTLLLGGVLVGAGITALAKSWSSFDKIRPGADWSPLLVIPVAALIFWVFPAAAAYWPGRLWRIALASVLVGSLWPAVTVTLGPGALAPVLVAVVCYGLLAIDVWRRRRAGRQKEDDQKEEPKGEPRGLWKGFSLILVVLAGAALLWAVDVRPGPKALLLVCVAAACYLALAVSFLYRWEYREPLARRRNLTAGLRLALGVAAGAAVLAFVDGVGIRLYAFVVTDDVGWKTFLTVAGLAAPFALAQRFASRLAASAEKIAEKVPREGLAAGAALLATTAALVAFSALAYAIALQLKEPGSPLWTAAMWGPIQVWGVVIAAAVALGLSLLLGHTRSFLNLSSHHTLYAARLTRAYLGASNRVRGYEPKALSDPTEGDDIPWREYRPHAQGGPLHIVNVTMNETIPGKTQVEQRTRKGKNLAVGPCGVSLSARHHALWKRAESNNSPESALAGIARPGCFEVFSQGKDPNKVYTTQVESLRLGQWVAISGAAFTTGLGTRTSIGLSLLLGMANIRLGHWWNSGLRPDRRECATEPTFERAAGLWFTRCFPVQCHLLDELLARFHGTGRQLWYLSDGGHFENTAGYELVRRRIPFIILCDNGCDPDYEWADVGNLVRRVRTDFGAEVEFLDKTALDAAVDGEVRESFAPWPDLHPPRAEERRDGAYATLARISYPSSPVQSTLMIIKPNLLGTISEPADLLTYQREHSDFPQQTTLDQYFDEAQWESYRRLGEWIGDRLFQKPPAGQSRTGWTPFEMKPLRAPATRSTPSLDPQAGAPQET